MKLLKLWRKYRQCWCWLTSAMNDTFCITISRRNPLCSDCKHKPTRHISEPLKHDGLRADFVIVDEIHDCKAAISERWISKSERNLEKLVKEIEYYLTENKVTVRGTSGEKLIFTDQETGEEYVVQDLGYPI